MEFSFPFDADESIGLFWICTNALRAYSAYKGYVYATEIVNRMRNAPILDTYYSSSTEAIKSGSATQVSIPYAIMTGKVEHSANSLRSNDGRTEGVVRCVRKDLECLLSILNRFQPSFSINVDHKDEAVPFVLYNEKNLTSFHVKPVQSDSIGRMESNLKVVSRNVAPVEGSMLSWLAHLIPGFELFFRDVFAEKMLPVNMGLTVMGKAMANSQNRQIYVSDPENYSAPYIITTLSPLEIMKSTAREAAKRLGFSLYFTIFTATLAGVLAVDVYYKHRRNIDTKFFQNSFMNLYFLFCTFGAPMLIPLYLKYASK